VHPAARLQRLNACCDERAYAPARHAIGVDAANGIDRRSESLALYTPETLFVGRVEEVAAARQRALDDAYGQRPERFVRGRPIAKRPPALASINPAPPETTVSATALAVAPGPQASSLRNPSAKLRALRCFLARQRRTH
jgi:hypothetical protein